MRRDHVTLRGATIALFQLAAACGSRDGRAAVPQGSGAAAATSYRRPVQVEAGWSTATPELFGLATAPLEDLTARIAAGEYGNVHALLIARSDRLVYEAYFTGRDRRWRDGRKLEIETNFGRDTLHGVRSVTKSITSAVFGAARCAASFPSRGRVGESHSGRRGPLRCRGRCGRPGAENLLAGRATRIHAQRGRRRDRIRMARRGERSDHPERATDRTVTPLALRGRIGP